MSFFAKLAVLISANTTEFKAGLDDATKSTKKFEAEQKRAMRESAKAAKELEQNLRLAATALTAVGAASLYAFSYADKINDTAKAFDVTIASLLSMRGALQNAGGEADAMATMLQKLASNADDAIKGSDKARAAFEQLGISGKEVETLAIDELFSLVAKSLSEVDNTTRRSAASMELLGKASKTVDWKEYWENFRQGKGTTEQVSAAIEAGATAWDNLKNAGVAALEAILVLVKPFADFINFLARAAKATKSGTLSGSSLDAEFGGAFGMTPPDITPSGPSATKPPSAIAATQNRKSGGYSTLPASQAGFAAATEAVRQQTEEIMRQVSAMVKREEIQSKLIAMTKNEREIAQEVFRIQEERDKLIANAQKEIEIEQKRAVINQDRIKALQDQIEAIRYAKEVEIEATTAIIQKRQEEQQSFTIGWERAFRQYAEDSQNYARLGEQAFNTVISNMDMLLRNFVQTGKLNFKDFARSIISDLIMIQLRMQAMGLAKMAMRSISGFGFGTGIGYGSQDYGQYFADGGQPPINQPAIVGEQGPELFIPRTAGTVIPNQQLSNYIGNQPQIVYNGPYIQNMSAIDTQSATQFLSSNRQAVYAANLSASRSIPASR